MFDRQCCTARSRNTALNMVRRGGPRWPEVLNAAGIHTLHDVATLLRRARLHRAATSAAAPRRAGVSGGGIRRSKCVLDVHRDAIEDSRRHAGEAGVRLSTAQSTAQVMVIAGCDNGSSAALPNWRLNLRFAAAWEAAMEGASPGLTRPVLCGYRFYNQDLTTGSLC